MHLKQIHSFACAVILIAFSGCSHASIQSDKSIKEERSSAAETGPLVAKAVVRMNDGTPVRKRTFQFVTISRDERGGLKQVDISYSITGDTDDNGNLSFSVPRDQISAGKEFSFSLRSSNTYGAPAIIRRKDAKEPLTFKADEKTKTVDLGEVVVPLG